MFKNFSSKLFYIFFVLMIILLSLFRQPDIKAWSSSFYRVKLLDNFTQALLDRKTLDAEEYWHFREVFSPGSFTYNQDAVEFRGTFRIASVKNLTPLFFYNSKNINSIDGVVHKDEVDNLLKDFKEEYKFGEFLVDEQDLLLIKMTDKNYELLFIEPTSKMQKVNGLFDYKTQEREVIKDFYWYNKTSIKL